MGNHLIQSEDKLFLYMKHATSGMAEIDSNGNINYPNLEGEAILKPVISAHSIDSNNLFDILAPIVPELVEKIKNIVDDGNNTTTSKPQIFQLSFGTGKMERRINLSVNKIPPDCIIICFEDIAEKNINDKALQQALLDKAVVQGKFEIAANVLHDIGNAVVGFSSYLSRIKRSLELDNSENLQNLVGFFEAQRTVISPVLGEAKADAIVKIISGIAQTQKTNQTDIGKSITEQQNIINHIQEILNIQRQYISGTETIEKKPTYLSSLIEDCMSMVFASLNKRNITVTLDVPKNLPVIKGDRTKLMQVILNIIKNSIEAIDIYAVEKSIAITACTQNDFIILNINDSGKGFDHETGKKIFTRGFTTKRTGTGLGLDHCRAILEGHDGTISITSDGPGKGAQTIIKLKI